MADLSIVTVQAEPLTKESFQPFGQVSKPIDDGKPFDDDDAQLAMQNGTPRFYLTRLHNRGLQFQTITHHAKVTQCLGCLGSDPWYMAVAPPNTAPTELKDKLKVFKIPAGEFIKMECGTWHAGPLFDAPAHMDFYYLELSDTNVADNNDHHFDKSEGTAYKVSI